VRRAGLEPARRLRHQNLNLARLPISPPSPGTHRAAAKRRRDTTIRSVAAWFGVHGLVNWVDCNRVTELEDTIAAVEAGLQHAFADRALLLDALTHSSFAHERPTLARADYERLEYMGDAVLQWAVSALLFDRYPGATAGELTRRRADLVCEEGLAHIARAIGVGPGLRLGRGEERSGGRDKPRLLASALEACVAAVYLDAGTDAAMHVCRALFEQRLERMAPGARDFKTRMQEALQRRGQKPPSYELLAVTGPDHARSFQVAICSDGQELGRGEGRSKLEAEQAAAELALQALND
jgi:ribonuclease-3